MNILILLCVAAFVLGIVIGYHMQKVDKKGKLNFNVGPVSNKIKRKKEK